MAVLAVVAAGPGVAGGVPALDPLDLALHRGEAVFESVRVYAGRPFRLPAHLDRLAASAAALERPLPDGLEALAPRAGAAAGGGDAVLRIIGTKGREGQGEPAAFAICTDLPASYETERRRGLKLVLLTTAADPLVRAASPWLLAGVKTIDYAVNMAAQRAARARRPPTSRPPCAAWPPPTPDDVTRQLPGQVTIDQVSRSRRRGGSLP